MNRRIIAFLSCGMNKYPPVPVVSKLQNFYVKMALFCYFFSAAADGNFCLEVCSCQSGKILSTKRMTGADILTVTLLKQDGGSCQKITRSIHFQGSKLRGVLNHYKCLFIYMSKNPRFAPCYEAYRYPKLMSCICTKEIYVRIDDLTAILDGK